MFILLPLSHEHMEAQRFPYVTLGIILINVLAFIVTVLIAPGTQEVRFEREAQLVDYYTTHPYLDLPEETFVQLAPQHQQMIEYARRVALPDTLAEVNQNTALMDAVMREFAMGEEIEEEQDSESREEYLARIRQEEQEQFDELVMAFEESFANDFYMKYGYIPARGGILTIFTSIFLHGGFFHLLFNMLFLWLSGCNIEDLWGRVVYPIFYLAGGILATLAHGMMFPESSIPLIGASGAIAAAMGAFMIRMYKTRIYFVYLFFFGFRLKRGKFRAPAYVMLPLWLLQQFWGVLSAGTAGSGVAFWAHIGGFLFGAAVATLFKVTGFESNVLAPAIEKKTAVVDEHLASGIAKLQDDDAAGAIKDLKAALQTNPNDPMAHGELSKAYFKQGDRRLALREFKRAIFFYMKRGQMDDAIDQYLELQEELPELMLDSPQQMKIATAIEERVRAQHASPHPPSDKQEAERRMQLAKQAALAYRKIVTHYQKQGAASLDHPDALLALTRYADLNGSALQRPQEAYKAYQFLLRSSAVPAEQKQQLSVRSDQAKQAVAAQQKALKTAKEAQKTRPAPASQQQAAKTAAAAPSASPRNVPLHQRIKLAPDVDAPAKYQVASLAPLEANKVLPAAGGLNLKRVSEPPLLFQEISAICAFQMRDSSQSSRSSSSAKGKKKDTVQVFESSEEIILADLFAAGKSRPYRIASNRIAYTQFFSDLQRSSLANFRQFVLYIISNIDAVYLDQGTIQYLKTGKPQQFPSTDDLKIHEKIFWKQLRGAVRFRCAQCDEVYWVDGAKVPDAGVKTTCAKCGHPIYVRKNASTS